ncbi:hypothetical protein [Thermogemmatispora sp.]|uniref:hypothetical protein n=1 Tax=Thermogemmatispora sp. TaxID=1968838 RepID=UPI0035E45B3A
MFKRYLSLTVIALLINLVCVTSGAASTNPEKEARAAAKVKAGILRLGTGTEARVKVKLKDNRKVEGYISEAGEDSFVVVNPKTGEATTVPYPQVQQVKGNNFSRRTVIVIGIVVGLVILAAIAVGKSS